MLGLGVITRIELEAKELPSDDPLAASSGTELKIHPLQQWFWRNPYPTGSSLQTVTYGNGLFVAAGTLGTIVVSPDGESWSQVPPPTKDSIIDIAHGNGAFVAVARPAQVLYSADGTQWVAERSEVGVPQRVLFGDGRFVVLGTNYTRGSRSVGNIAVSQDGRGWRVVAAPLARDLAYSDGKWWLAGTAGSVYQSTDLVNWIWRHPETGQPLHRIAANGQQVFVSAHRFAAVSSDGIEWTPTQLPFAMVQAGQTSVLEVVQGKFVTFGPSGSLLISADGRSWSPVATGARTTFKDIAAGPERFVAVGDNGAVAVSTNLLNWKLSSGGYRRTLRTVEFGGSQFIAAGEGAMIFRSTETGQWIQTHEGIRGGDITALAYNNGLWIAVGSALGSSPGLILRSTDGVVWEAQTPVDAPVNDVATGNGMLVAVSNAGTIFTSSDGIQWNKESLSLSSPIHSVAFGNGQFLALAAGKDGGTVLLHSTTGKEWQISTLHAELLGRTVRFVDGEFLISLGSQVLRSKDGREWKTTSIGPIKEFVGAGALTAAVASDTLLISPGSSWASTMRFPGVELHDVAYGDNSLVVVGEDGSILQSAAIPADLIRIEEITRERSGRTRLRVSAPPNTRLLLQTSTDLVEWRDQIGQTGRDDGGIVEFQTLLSGSRVFYRVISR